MKLGTRNLYKTYEERAESEKIQRGNSCPQWNRNSQPFKDSTDWVMKILLLK